MKRIHYLAVSLLLVFLFSSPAANAQKADQYSCKEPNAETLCTAANTCGSETTPCTVTVKKDGSGANVTPNTTDAKANKLFCVKVGTTINYEAGRKNTGFVVDFGPKSPFDSDESIQGGSKKGDSAVAKNAGCYRFSAGACVSGAIHGMCGSRFSEMVVIK